MWKRAISLVHKSTVAVCTRPCLRSLHSSAAVFTSSTPSTLAGQSSSSSNANNVDLDDLFGEEQASSDVGVYTSNLSSVLSSTRATTSSSLSSSSSSTSSGSNLEDQLKLLDPSNPPKLERKHMELLKRALEETRKKKNKAITLELNANPQKQPPTNSTILQLTKQESVLSDLVIALFPPRAVFDEKSTSDIVDFAESMPGVLNVITPDKLDPLASLNVNNQTTRKNRHQFCLFCKPDTSQLPKNQLVYTNLNLITQFLNERGLILQRDQTRLCMKHQHKISRCIKQARNIGLLSSLSNWRVDPEFVYGESAKDFNPHSTLIQKNEVAKQMGFSHDQVDHDIEQAAKQFGDNQPLEIDYDAEEDEEDALDNNGDVFGSNDIGRPNRR